MKIEAVLTECAACGRRVATVAERQPDYRERFCTDCGGIARLVPNFGDAEVGLSATLNDDGTAHITINVRAPVVPAEMIVITISPDPIE